MRLYLMCLFICFARPKIAICLLVGARNGGEKWGREMRTRFGAIWGQKATIIGAQSGGDNWGQLLGTRANAAPQMSCPNFAPFLAHNLCPQKSPFHVAACARTPVDARAFHRLLATRVFVFAFFLRLKCLRARLKEFALFVVVLFAIIRCRFAIMRLVMIVSSAFTFNKQKIASCRRALRADTR